MTHSEKSRGPVVPDAGRYESKTGRTAMVRAGAYATCGELQSRHLQRRCGLSRDRSRLIAGLFFGEGR